MRKNPNAHLRDISKGRPKMAAPGCQDHPDRKSEKKCEKGKIDPPLNP